MQQVNVFACVGDARSSCSRSELVRIHSIYATALKPPHEAGGRGGESTARSINDHCIILLAYESSHEMLSLRFRRVLSLR
ncbi:hypothetical protein D9F07_03915 [Escherichia coli]|nr:hypothetical protein [Escherichia coli]EFB2107357.1 hypothetical protein [Escherichia coli]EFH9176762.1 hypothetical protein [Escherichia coli]MGJ47352.1 hypothetical protein [Escherichia coli]MHP80956.1 hypothetical protein [Escherichia coli]